MGEFIFAQLNFIRGVTLNSVKDLTESQVDVIPSGFSNNIRWNLGHLYFVQEQFAFRLAQEPVQIPAGFAELFGKGTKPADWQVQPPSLPELLHLLEQQPKRIKNCLHNRVDEQVAHPFALPGLTLNSIGQLLAFSVYHEGNHAQAIKLLNKLSSV